MGPGTGRQVSRRWIASDLNRTELIAGSGLLIVLIGFGAVFLPRFDEGSRATVMGTMMVTAGIVEMLAGCMRLRHRDLAIIPAVLTALFGALLAVHPLHRFVPSVWLVITWLGARGVIIGASATVIQGPVRVWTVIASATDLGLAGILTFGLSASTITLTFFGITREVIQSFAWVLALSFIATGMLLLEVAACERVAGDFE